MPLLCCGVSLCSGACVVELTNPNESCTSIAAGKLATTDGSVMTSQTCDGTSRTWMEGCACPKLAGHRKTRSLLGSPSYGKQKRPFGCETERFYPTGSLYICLSEYWLSLYERETAGDGEKRLSWDVRSCVIPKACSILRICRGIALQRCSTAREAVLLMGRLAEQYGYRDGGECLTVADKRELWFFEITGAGSEDMGLYGLPGAYRTTM